MIDRGRKTRAGLAGVPNRFGTMRRAIVVVNRPRRVFGADERLVAVAAGAGTMYLFDPDAGRRRRARLRDRAARILRRTRGAAEAAYKDTANRARGLAAEARSGLTADEIDDEVLVERVRSRLGEFVSHPSSIEVEAKEGLVVLRGPILAGEAKRALRAVKRVRGVRGIDDHLDVIDDPSGVPGLQGRGRVSRRTGTESWPPRRRVVVGAAGAWLAAFSLARRGPAALAAGVAGGTLVARAATNLPMRRMTGVGARRRAVDFRKSITIDAPVEKVFEYWSDYESFPKFMTHVRSVSNVGADRYRWEVDGPAGAPVKFDAVVSAFERNRRIGWKTVPGAAIEHAGIVRFEPGPDGGTRVDLQMTYNPVAGSVGHAAAKLLGADVKSQLDDDLLRLKTLLETGTPPSDAARTDL